jgi:hypothetical protein
MVRNLRLKSARQRELKTNGKQQLLSLASMFETTKPPGNRGVKQPAEYITGLAMEP